jgi:hypothetical protein
MKGVKILFGGVHYQFVNCYPRLFGFRYQPIGFLLLTPDCKVFAQKMNKLMGENHFNKSVMLLFGVLIN